MTIYSVLQTSSNSELSPDVLDNSYKDYSKAVAAAKSTLEFSQGDYDTETEIYTIKDDQGKVTSFELWTAGQDYWLETAKICETTVK